MVSVIIPAAGQGRRMQAHHNKVFLMLAKEPILVHTLRQFAEVEDVGECIVVVGKGEEQETYELLKSASSVQPLPDCRIVTGGEERQDSVWNGLQVVSPDADIVLVHDAARPLVTPAIIGRVIRAARRTGGAVAAVPVKDTIKVAGDDGNVASTPDRSTLWAVQTPQGFQKDLLVRANEQAIADGFRGTDDASLVERLGMPVELSLGSYENIKITTPGDLIIAESFWKARQESDDIRVPEGRGLRA
ncbi:2-C-methyl-D-erythritol 4-phosphate cytidylyltransferase [uncultured Selenomonas sp.]|uniref:2-C-methyl-D-erythritol 4-phosphate cytidylyltransferase n=1 Tax=uncultured Selenomonas sp. TaxID=159275 RepID=UPI0025F48147|nr:2-C-methyl-D-erythritol 4-phosphate cytidylyltransferase [uncultured Selenomonas sp.]